MTPFEIADSIVQKVSLESLDGYVPYLVNKSLSYRKSAIMAVDYLGRYQTILTTPQQYAFLFGVVPKGGKQFVKWGKEEPDDDLVQKIVNRYKVNRYRAKEILSMLTLEQKERIIQSFFVGKTVKN